MISVLLPIARAFVEMLQPLRDVVADPTGGRFVTLLGELGWIAEAGQWVSQLPLARSLPPILAEADDVLDRIIALQEGGDDVGGLVSEALDLADAVFRAISDVAANPPSGGDVPVELQQASFWTELAADLPEYLLVRWIQARVPVLYGVLRLVGVIEAVSKGGAGGRQVVEVDEIRMGVLLDLLRDPAGTLAEHFGWTRDRGTSQFTLDRAAWLLDELELAFALAQVRVRRGRVREVMIGSSELFSASSAMQAAVRELALPMAGGFYLVDAASVFVEQGLLLVPIPEDPDDAEVAGLYVGNLSVGAVTGDLDLSDSWMLRMTGAADVSAALGLLMFPGQAPKVRVDPGVSTDLGLTLASKEEAGPWLPIGAPFGSRVEVHGVQLSARLLVMGSEPELIIEGRTASTADRAGVVCVIEPGQGDAFVQDLLGGEPIEAEVDVGVSWSSTDGLRVQGSVGVSVDIPLNKSLGPIYLQSLTLGLQVGTDGAALALGLTASATLGPFVLVVDNVGFVTELVPASDNRAMATIGDLAITIDFKPPDGLGLSLDAGVVTGGGYLDFDADEGRYAGVLQLEFLSFGLTAMGILHTELPDGSPGWALLLSISSTVPPIPLGFGFFLQGVGGLIAVNRSMDVDVLASGMADGSIDYILFPDDPIAQAPAMLAGMDAAFPIRTGSFVLGPMVQISWGVPSVVSISGGILVTLPEPLEVALIGQLDVVLGTDTFALIELHVDLLGTADFEEGALSLFANIRDSHVVGLPLKGSMAFIADFVGQPYFLLSFGGFHPDYQPPAPVPFEMARMGFGLDLDAIQVTMGSYFAVTSNSVQFGAEFSVSAKAMGFSVVGEAYFHVLFQFDPLKIRASVGFSVTIFAGSWELLAVALDLTVTGPNPWKGTGIATFKFLGKGIDFAVSGQLGTAKATTPLPKEQVAERLVAALRLPDAWAGVQPTDAVVRLREVPNTEQVEPGSGDVGDPIHWVWPDGRVEVTQRVAPLDVELDKYGEADISGPRTLTIGEAKLSANPVSNETVEDWFAPSSYFDLTEAERLSTSAYQEMSAGVRFGGEGVQKSRSADVDMSYEDWVWTDREADPSRLGTSAATSTDLKRGLAGSLKAKQAQRVAGGGRFRSVASEITVSAERFVVAGADTANVRTSHTARAGVSQIQAVLARRRGSTPDHEVVVLPKAEAGQEAS